MESWAGSPIPEEIKLEKFSNQRKWNTEAWIVFEL